ncbi:hypothetical protein LEN26_015777 [Aphanomyces euteiches]|nr:hypothetical protein LEN26_015777 [Aphanomyces euteiches]KAH9102260.1 hypothetical protein AeMF1_021125 [Aphanomyces euteiches]KAH9197237.1 hypothetical protein AeNC1_000775 [Aphanomyces euteiches]
MLHCQAAACNQDVILDTLLRLLANRPTPCRCLEIASGTGQHVVHFAKALPYVHFQPSECDERCLMSIQAYIAATGVDNVDPPLYIDVTMPFEKWGLLPGTFDVCINVNMVHITPWECSEAMFEKVAKCLVYQGILIMYGPFAINGEIFPDSNVRFDAYLRRSNPSWGYRDIRDLEAFALRHGMRLEETLPVASNNYILVWHKICTSE